jgi:tRNA-(ms[2]io[6]A)-hydroxylase
MLCLTVPTDAAWIQHALADLNEVLVDHAHCEMKAAANALSLAARHPDDMDLVLALTALAREELDHFERVLGFLRARGLSLGAPPVDPYARELRRAANPIGRDGGLVTRLLVGALIEARSCERFKLLIEALRDRGEPELLAFYEELFAAEARHFRVYTDLAVRAAGGDRARVDAELAVLARQEGDLVRRLADEADRATVHG